MCAKTFSRFSSNTIWARRYFPPRFCSCCIPVGQPLRPVWSVNVSGCGDIPLLQAVNISIYLSNGLLRVFDVSQPLVRTSLRPVMMPIGGGRRCGLVYLASIHEFNYSQSRKQNIIIRIEERWTLEINWSLCFRPMCFRLDVFVVVVVSGHAGSRSIV